MSSSAISTGGYFRGRACIICAVNHIAQVAAKELWRLKPSGIEESLIRSVAQGTEVPTTRAGVLSSLTESAAKGPCSQAALDLSILSGCGCVSPAPKLHIEGRRAGRR